MTHLERRNERLYGKFYRFIEAVDRAQNKKTDFTRKLPRRRAIGNYE